MDLKTRGALPAGPQVRSYPASFEVRALSGSKVELNGYASTFDTPYEMYDMFGAYTEVVRQGAFSKTLADGPDVAYLANHEGLTMARTNSGSLRLTQDATGLLTSATVNTTRSDVRDLVAAVEDGDVDQMSFAFRVVRQEWSPDFDQRDMIELNIDRGDVSAVNFGASPNTNVGVARAFRSHRPAELHRIAVELRDGRTLDERAAVTLADILDRMAGETDSRKTDTPEEPVEIDADVLEFLKRQLEHEAR
jgi:HK97 family phage prohead protease